MSELHNGQQVKVKISHNHISACNETIYEVGAINRLQGEYKINLLLNGKSAGVVPEKNLIAK